MSIIFTDTALKATSKDILLLPFVINDPQTGYVAQKAALQTQSTALLADDNNKKVFYDFWKTVIASYHGELEYLNSQVKSVYSDSDLTDGGFQRGVHYPQNIVNALWLAPTLINSMNGLPASFTGVTNETSRITDVTTYINYLKNGFNDGSDVAAVSGVTMTQCTVDSGSAPQNGDRIIINNGSNSFFALVTNVSGVTVTHTFLGGVLVGSGTCRNFHVGFTNSERSHASTNYANDVMIYFENQLDAAVVAWKVNFDAQKVFIDSNGDYAPRKVNNILASADIFSLNLAVTGWQALAYNARYVDSGLLILENNITTRNAQVPARITQIGTFLGSVTQNSSGVLSGTGVYFELTDMINSRISRTGSLCKYNNSFLGIAYFDKIIADANAQLANYQQTMVVKTITQDVSVSDIVVKVDDVSQLSVGNTVKLFDNVSNVYTRTISLISGLDVTLNTAMVAPLAIGQLARMTKEL